MLINLDGVWVGSQRLRNILNVQLSVAWSYGRYSVQFYWFVAKSYDQLQYYDQQLYFLAIRIIASNDTSTSSSVVAQLLTLIRIALLPCHLVPLAQQVPSS